MAVNRSARTPGLAALSFSLGTSVCDLFGVMALSSV